MSFFLLKFNQQVKVAFLALFLAHEGAEQPDSDDSQGSEPIAMFPNQG